MSCSATRLAWLIGMAKPRPTLPPWVPGWLVPPGWIAELMPITAPFALSSGPPELPGLIDASVWIALMYEALQPCPSLEATGRCTALTMPVVTVPDRPYGAPIAMVASPTAALSELPSGSGVSLALPAFFSLTTATS